MLCIQYKKENKLENRKKEIYKDYVDYDEYIYDGKAVMIFKNDNMIALINVDSIVGIYLKSEDEVKA